MTSRPRRPRRILVLAFDGVQSLDVVGPFEVFASADDIAGGGAYTVELVAPHAGMLRCSSGMGLVADRSLEEARNSRPDTLVVAGGVGAEAAAADEEIVSWVRAVARRSRRVTSVCTGAFILAAAGLLEGRRATTHWLACDLLASRYPDVMVDPDPIFVRDGNITTSAGVTSGMDLALELVEDDLGRDIALSVARMLVLYLRRPGGQAQFSAHMSAQMAQPKPLRDLQHWIAANLDTDLSVPALARRARMSPRTFARRFAAEVGDTPGRYVTSVRVDTAKRLLLETDDGLSAIAARCGFGSEEVMRRMFSEKVGTTPGSFRMRFRTARIAYGGESA